MSGRAVHGFTPSRCGYGVEVWVPRSCRTRLFGGRPAGGLGVRPDCGDVRRMQPGGTSPEFGKTAEKGRSGVRERSPLFFRVSQLLIGAGEMEQTITTG